MTVGQLKSLLGGAREDEEAMVCVSRCEEVRNVLSGGEWVVVSGYFAIERVRVGDGAVVIYAAEEAG